MITDLVATDSTFTTEASDWNSASTGILTSGQLWMQYGTVYIMGGPDVLQTDGSFYRQYKHLPSHNIIYFSMTVYLIDNWHYDSSFHILFDKKSFTLGLFLMDSSLDFTTSTIDPTHIDLPAIRLYGKAKHRGSPLTLRVGTLSHDTQDKSLGFRDITLLFRNYTEDEPETNQMCGITEVPLQLNQCPCFESMYADSTGTCQSCDPLCKTCLGPATSQCLSCADNAYFNETDCAECDSSSATCKGGTDTDCKTCNSGDYFLNGNACVSSCTTPFVASGTTCTDPCYASGQYLYADPFQCAASCPSTYNGYVWHGSKLCFRYCPGSLYYVPPADSSSTGVCQSSCPSGYNTDTTARYCTACSDSLCMTCANDPAVCQECQNGAILDTDGVCKGNLLIFKNPLS